MGPVAAVEGDLLELEGDSVPQVVRLAKVLQRQRADLRLRLPLLSLTRRIVQEHNLIEEVINPYLIMT